MSIVNSARFEESSEIVIDSEVLVPDAGWALTYASVNRVGSLVALHIAATHLAGAAAPVLTLPADFAPGATITNDAGTFSLTAAGVLSFTGSTVAAGAAACQLVYAAGEVSP